MQVPFSMAIKNFEPLLLGTAEMTAKQSIANFPVESSKAGTKYSSIDLTNCSGLPTEGAH